MANNPSEITNLEISELVPSFERWLRIKGKSPETVKTYRGGVNAYTAWAADAGQPVAFSASTVEDFTLALLEKKQATGTIVSRQSALKSFSAWWSAENGLPNPLAGMELIKVIDPIVNPLTRDEIIAFIEACKGPRFIDLRDEAIFRLLIVTIMRATEMAELLLADTKVDTGTTLVRRGKGGEGRLVAFDEITAYAIDRYLRKRKQHKHAQSPQLWLSQSGSSFSYGSMHYSLRYRAEKAGIEGFHIHRTRHTGADRWLGAGGSEGGLMATGGWKSRRMMDRYTKRRSSVRAIEESHRLNLGDF